MNMKNSEGLIRAFTHRDIDRIMELWLVTNIVAHSFIESDYWREHYEQVKAMMPQATLYVYEQNAVIQGFIGLIENDIAGIFVDESFQSRGIGKKLLDYAKERTVSLALHVYQENERAVQFYLREGFFISSAQNDEQTGRRELVLQWRQIKTIAVSACLCGVACRYDGKSKAVKVVIEQQQPDWLLICPEVNGRLATPRIAAEIVGGDGYDVLNGKAKVVTRAGDDVTQAFILGAYRTLRQIQEQPIQTIVLKQNSPSCGSEKIYDGSFQGQLQLGVGVTTALLRSHGYQVIDENAEKIVR